MAAAKGGAEATPPQVREVQRWRTNEVGKGVYPIIQDDDTTFAFAEFIHNKGSAILHAAGGPRAPQVYVSLMEGSRIHIAKSGSTTGIFRPDSLSQAPGKAKHFFPGFTVRFLKDHQFVNSARVLETLTPWDYQGQFHWHDGQGRMTIDASSYPLTADGSKHPHFSADFAYYSLLVWLGLVIQAWVTAKASASPFRLAPSPQQEPRHELATSEFLKIPEWGLQHTGHWAPGSSSGAHAAAPFNFQGQPFHAPHFLAAQHNTTLLNSSTPQPLQCRKKSYLQTPRNPRHRGQTRQRLATLLDRLLHGNHRHSRNNFGSRQGINP
jgi:hypothetical protein